MKAHHNKKQFIRIFFILIGVLSIQLPVLQSFAQEQDQEQEVAQKLSDKEESERRRHLQILKDRIINKKPQFALNGPLIKINDALYSVNGEQFFLTPDTQVFGGNLRVGNIVEVRGFLVPGEPKVADQVSILDNIEQGLQPNSRSKGNQNGDFNTRNSR